MSGIDHEVACRNLNINPNMKCVAQRRRKQSAEKTDAAKTIIKGLVQAKFISNPLHQMAIQHSSDKES
jgi:hypothetical protein